MLLLHEFFPIAVLIAKRVLTCNRMFDDRLLKRSKIAIFCLITFSAIIFLILCDDLIYQDSLRPSATKGPEEVLQARPHRNGEGIRSTLVLTHSPLRSMKQNEGVGKGNQGVLVAPFNSTEEERIVWFKGKLHEFKILQSDGLSRQFHARILGFFSHECESQFFMTWEYPAGSFEARELLSIESLFKVHPKACLAILSRTLDSILGYRILKPLLDRRFRVQAVAPDLPFLFKGTPAEAWLNELMKGKKDPGKISLFQNLSNLMRLAVLYKYGGVYLDTDFIVLKPLSVLRNSIGAQSMDSGNKNWTRLNNAVLIFDMNHPLLLRFINEFVLTFNGNKWGHNGPYLVSRVVERLGERPGFNLTILPPLAFYPADLKRIGGLFRKPKTRGESKWVEAKLLQLSSESYGVHLWNKESRNLKIEDGSVVARLICDRCIICKYL
ncbi:lactosylceramide 4-alpha-galactosyltransferase-like [Vigna umbellata]|uniref:lactosylceramide 4-alpha-galactosyltransferase-like n=1 Tax=Vigna umbellata TaxID=87088 RepID=UPI001F5F8EAC|nr:lactosylceramide 4-alpha-galactosyltransferase-like [Vigna umbellata]